MNYLIDKDGKPYEEGKSFPAGGGLDSRCTYNGDALYAFYSIKHTTEIDDYLKRRGFKIVTDEDNLEVLVKGDTKIVFELYDGLWGYLRTEYIGEEKAEETANVGKCRKWRVSIIRTGYGYKDFEVEADNEDEAKELAMELAVNTSWDEDDAHYEFDYTEEIEDDE